MLLLRVPLLPRLAAARALASTRAEPGPKGAALSSVAPPTSRPQAPPPRLPLSLSYVHGASSTPLLGITVGASLELTANAHPGRAGLVCVQEGKEFSYGDLLRRADRISAGLLSLGLTQGDRVGIWGPNSSHWVLSFLASLRAGIVLVNINPAYQPKELEFALKKVDCKAIISAVEFKGRNYLDLLTQICPELPTCCPGELHSQRLPALRAVISMGAEGRAGIITLHQLESMATPALERQRAQIHATLSPDDPINIQYTSGTTGEPKGAMLTHHNLLNNANLLGRRMGYHLMDMRLALQVPLYHCFGLVAGMISCVAHAGTAVMPSVAYNARATLTAIQEHRCTVIYGTPTMFVDMLNDPNFESFDLSSLQTGMVAGSTCPPELFRRVVESMKLPYFVNSYGTTENSPVTFCGFPGDPVSIKAETVGQVLQHVEAKVVSAGWVSEQAGTASPPPLPAGEQGELLVRGHCVMRGYWDDPEKTRHSISPDGWYLTGDLAVIDQSGYCRIVGRLKDLIIRGGENVYPAEVEAELHTHPLVSDAQVVGVRDKRMGEEICACIRLRPNTSPPSSSDMREFCASKMAHFKIPRYFEFVDSYPLTVTGKIQKFKLKEQMEKKLGLK